MKDHEISHTRDTSEELEALVRNDAMIFRIATVLLALLFVLSAILGTALATKSAELSEQEIH
jgi:hypothetical protein